MVLKKELDSTKSVSKKVQSEINLCTKNHKFQLQRNGRISPFIRSQASVVEVISSDIVSSVDTRTKLSTKYTLLLEIEQPLSFPLFARTIVTVTNVTGKSYKDYVIVPSYYLSSQIIIRKQEDDSVVRRQLGSKQITWQ